MLTVHNVAARASTDPTRLQQHLSRCNANRGRLHRAKGAAESIDAFVSPRLVTTLALLAAMLTGLVWLLT